MRTVSRLIGIAVVLAAHLVFTTSQSIAQEQQKERTGSIAGRVTSEEKPVARVAVVLNYQNRQQRSAAPSTVTDDEGRYRFNGVPAGSYTVIPYAPTLVPGIEYSRNVGPPGRAVVLGNGEEIEGVDFSLTRGGVVTGRVTNADGLPVVEQHVMLMPVAGRGVRGPFYPGPGSMYITDDRGVYRIYGVTPGRYKVCVGATPTGGSGSYPAGTFVRTFHPDVTDESAATIVEVSAGSESTGVDVRLGQRIKTYTARGRIIDANTGRPRPDLFVGQGQMSSTNNLEAYSWGNSRTNAKGEFRIEGLTPGKYAVFAMAEEHADFSSDTTMFEISNADVAGVEIKVRRGASLSGVAVIEGSEDPNILASLPKLDLYADVRGEGLRAPRNGQVRFNPDGTFRLTGLNPGK